MRVEQLWRFPVKSMRGERLTSATLTAGWIAGDRLVHVRNHRGVVTARTRPYCPGRRRPIGLGKVTATRIVPVFGSTSRSAARYVPFSYVVPSLRINSGPGLGSHA